MQEIEMAHARRWQLALLFTMLAAPIVRAEKELALRVTPQFCYEGCDVRVTVRVQPDAQNRALRIEADSPDYFRASQIELSGDSAARLHTLTLQSPPSGGYAVRAIVVRANGARLFSTVKLEVLGSPGASARRANR
jgi:hypothetical protein